MKGINTDLLEPGNDLKIINEKFISLKVCVIIPAHDDAGVLASIVEEVGCYTRNVIIADNDPTVSIRGAFKTALSLGYDHAITLDGNNRYGTKDLLVFIDKLENAPNTVIVGCHSIDEEALKKASFGLKCANFLFKVETGVDCPDVRSGFRLYPLQLLKNVKFITTGHHFETEVLVRAAWKSISIDSVPITVGPTILKANISPLKQLLRFASAFILQLCFIIIAFVYIKPRNFFRILINKKKRQVLLNQLFSSNYSPQVNAVSVGVGVFTGIIPIWGLQTFAALFFAIVFRLNKPLVIIASNISIPPMIPLVIFLSYRTGGYWMGKKNAAMPFSMHISLKLISLHLEQYIYGSLTLAFIAGLLAASLTFILLKVFKRSKFRQG